MTPDLPVDVVELIGSVAGVFTTLAFLPQVLQIWRTHSTRDVSLGMYLIFCSGVTLWLVYGLLIGSVPVVAANAVTLALASTILGMKLAWRKSEHAAAEPVV